MRKPENNPTERIGRLLVEMAELVSLVQAQLPGLMPRLPAYESEKTRRSLTYTRNVNRMRTRHSMNKAMGQPLRQMIAREEFYHEDAKRLADEMTQSDEVADPIGKPLSLEDIEIALKETREREANEIIERGTKRKD